MKKELEKLFVKYPHTPNKNAQSTPAPLVSTENCATAWVELTEAEGKICANDCGLFPPCTPLIRAGERIGKEQLILLTNAANVYGLVDKKILVVKEEE